MKHLAAPLVATLALALPALSQGLETERIEMPGELIVSFVGSQENVDLEAKLGEWDLQALSPTLAIDEARTLLNWQRRGEQQFTRVVHLRYSPASLAPTILREQLLTQPGVQWASPNVGYTGEVQELIPNDPLYSQQYHHPLMQNDDAWDITLGDASIIMGITDDGVDLDHEDLAANIWTNPGEIPGDGIDNDNNGYIDDVQGYDFVSDNNDPNPSNGNDHGTHVAGIAGARTDNGVGISGTAGRSTIMPLQFFNTSFAWTAADIAECFAYGADNGAQILSTSYNINIWVGDPTVTAAFDYIYDQGVLHFNSAGNGAELNPIRQSFHQTFLVANTDSNDVRSSSSNIGTGVDLAAPGSSIRSTILNNGYGLKSGTSMAAPNAAGVAALIWSANPTWTRAQVAAQLVFTCDNIDAQNPGLEGLLGGGRVNAFQALTQTLPAPQVASAPGLPSEGGTVIGELTSFKVRFDQILEPATVNAPGAFRLTYAGPDDLFGTMDDVPLNISWDEYLIAGNEVSFTPGSPLSSVGRYRFEADASVLTNPFGSALDGDADGIAGDSWNRTFFACGTTVVLVDNAEDGTDWSVVNENLSTGAWTQDPEVPIGGGVRNDPPTDFDGSGKCFLTQNGAGDTDVDGGPTRLISRAFDLSAMDDPYLSFARWLVSSSTDVMEVHISNDDGATWISVDTLTGTDGWEVEVLRVTDFVMPTAQTRLRFSVEDAGSPSITEAGIDTLRILSIDCGDDAVGSTYCVANPNSTGAAARIRAQGSDLVADNDFTLIAENLPQQPGLFYFGPDQVLVPFGEGFRCVGGTTVRILPTLVPDMSGRVERALDLTLPPAAGLVVPGANLNFQYWYRDPAGGGSNFNLSDGLNVDWQ